MNRIGCFVGIVSFVVSASGTFPTWAGHHTVRSFDGTKLNVYSETPLTLSSKEKFPLVIFINSWSVPGIEYLVKTIEWASKGYICVEYEARGWYLSGGLIDVGGPKNVRDATAIIDWALEEFPHADPTAIGMAGISYGAVISQLTAAADPRVRAVLAMSGTSDAYSDLYWQESISLAWGWVLVESGKVPFVGHEDPSVSEIYHDLTTHTNMSRVESWAKNRSMTHVIKQLNANGPAFYMSHQHEDNLFHSTIELEVFQSLNVSKKLDLNQGTHASAELLGLLGIDVYKTASDHIWNNAFRWIERWLKGVRNKVDIEPRVQMQVGGDGPRSAYATFMDWPPDDHYDVQTLYLRERGSAKWGGLATKSGGRVGALDTLSFSNKLSDDVMSTGILGLSDLFKVVVPIMAPLDKVNPRNGIVYKTPTQESPARICGIPMLTGLYVTAVEQRFQIVAYLYDVDEHNVGRLITHGVRTVWPEDSGNSRYAVMLPPIKFHTACYDMPAGHQLGLGLDMFDALYGVAGKSSIAIEYASTPSLHIPILKPFEERKPSESIVI